MMSDDDIVSVVRAHKEGKKIQFRTRKSNNPEWWDIATKTPAWNFEICEYRVAPEPRKPREWWLIKNEVQPLSHIDFRAYPCCQKGVQDEQIHVREIIE